MMRALQPAQKKSHPPIRSHAPTHSADRALSELLARMPAPLRNRMRISAYSAAREAWARIENESPRCACGGTCPKCQATDDLAKRRSAEHERLQQRERESDGMDSGVGAMAYGQSDPLADAASLGIEDDPVIEYSNGETSCDRDTGKMVTVINNTNCTRSCTVKHEDDHRAYRGTCCAVYAAARAAAIAVGDTTRRNALTQRYNNWVSTTSDFSECRAYKVSVTCGEAMESDLGCSTLTDANRACCADVRSYLTSVRSNRDSRCPGTDQACPDFSA